MNRSVRIVSLSMENFKNVKKGSICFENKRKDYKACILGVYGQNGSGKTALIDAIALLKHLLCGHQVPSKYADYINVDSKIAKLLFQFRIKYGEENFDVWYEFCLGKVEDESSVNMEENSAPVKYKAEIFDEILSFAYISKTERIRKSSLIDTRTSEVFVPRSKYEELVGENKEKYTDLLVNKKIIRRTSRGFIFSREMINTYKNNCHNELYRGVIEELVTFGNKELFIINTETSGLISLNALPLTFKYSDSRKETVGNLMLPLDAPSLIPDEAYEVVDNIINNMNIVLEQIVPGLTIGVKVLSPIVCKNGQPGKYIQFMSFKNEKEIPLQYESEGIKKIVSILQLLITVYNSPSITVAVDELDSGIFEYLLGEILKIISEKGKGQLIFTSHNLRPLETIDKGFIVFTTTNSENRYIRLSNVKTNNNLRDFYYRDIVLGEQSEQVYNPTNNSEIALAFREAGESFGS